MIVRHVGVLSVAKIGGILYTVLGFIMGICFAIFSTFAGFLGSMTGSNHEGPPPMAGAMFGVFGLFFWPIFYGLIGFVGGIISAWLYNVIAGWVGGIEVDLMPDAAARSASAMMDQPAPEPLPPAV